MSSGNEFMSQQSEGEGPSVSGDSFLELKMVRSDGPLVVRPLASVPPTQQTVGLDKEAKPLVPLIQTDEESTDDEAVLMVRMRRIAQQVLRRAAHSPMEASLKERDVPSEGEEEEEEEEGGAEQMGPSNHVATGRRKNEKHVVVGAVNIAIRGEVSYLASKLTLGDLERIEERNAGGQRLYGD